METSHLVALAGDHYPVSRATNRHLDFSALPRIDQTARVGIVGLGYVGLPLARAFVEKGFSVLGFDLDRRKVDLLEQGTSYIGHIPSASIQNMRDAGFAATEQMGR